MRGDGGNHHERLGLKRISCVSQFTIPEMAGTTPNLACKNTDTRSSQPNQASPTPDFTYPVISSVSFPSSSPISLSLPSLQNTKVSHPSLSLHTMMMS